MPNITHLTSAHNRYDTRIFIKMCRSLAGKGYNTSLVVADGKGDETRDDVQIYDVGASKGRRDRILYTPGRVLDKALKLNTDLYHLHDPELIPIALKLKRLGKKVIFDSHEDVPKQLLVKPYLSPAVLRLLSACYAKYEQYACSRFDAIIAATPFIRDKFIGINARTLDINNFPIIGELAAQSDNYVARSTVCYVGGMSAIRGIREMVQAMEQVTSDIRLEIAGCFSPDSLGAEVRQDPGWKKIVELGVVDRMGVRDLMSRSMVGLVTFLPAPNHIDAQPNKMFEYMSASIPVIASDFPLWREIVVGNECGICVDPLNPRAIAMAIEKIAKNPSRSYKMGQNGKRAVKKLYNWNVEKQKLFQLYETVLQGDQ